MMMMMKEESNHYFNLQPLQLTQHSNLSRNCTTDALAVNSAEQRRRSKQKKETLLQTDMIVTLPFAEHATPAQPRRK
jgi:hypothetical protein